MLWASLSSAWPIRACCLTWSSTTSPNPDSVDLFQSSPKIKNSRAGKRKKCKKPSSVPFLGTVSHPSFRLSQLLPRVPKESLGKEPAFLHEGQGKKLTFSALQSSPYSPASQPSCFPSSIKHYRDGGKKSLCSNDPSEKQSFPCEQNEAFVSKSAPTFNRQLPLFYLFKMWKKQKKAPSQWTCCPSRARRHPWGHRARRKCAGSAQPRPL